ncbi:MAG: STAS/SEC14 domain-containing protein [Desulfobacterales bacterium]
MLKQVFSWKKGTIMTIGFHEIQLEEASAGNIVTLKFKKKIDKEDFDEFVPRIEGLMKDGAKIRLVVELMDFEGWTAGALWEDTKFATQHLNGIDRLAVVGDARWEMGVTVFVKPFTSADVRYFDIKDINKARQWVREGW